MTRAPLERLGKGNDSSDPGETRKVDDSSDPGGDTREMT